MVAVGLFDIETASFWQAPGPVARGKKDPTGSGCFFKWPNKRLKCLYCGSEDVPLEVEDLATLHLDLMAAKEGFERGR